MVLQLISFQNWIGRIWACSNFLKYVGMAWNRIRSYFTGLDFDASTKCDPVLGEEVQ